MKSDGSLNEKYPGSVEAQSEKLKREGFVIEIPKNKKPHKVKDYVKFLV